MPPLLPTDTLGTITWLGRVEARDESIISVPAAELMARFDGVEGEAHSGLTRPACSRVATLYARDTEIRNVRQFSVVSAEELADIAAELGLEVLDPGWLGASMVIEGIPDFTHLPPSARLQGASGATLVVDMENRPCQFPAKVIEALHPGLGSAFKPAAKGRRGITAWVEREGLFSVGDSIRLHVPDQRAWAGAGAPA